MRVTAKSRDRLRSLAAIPVLAGLVAGCAGPLLTFGGEPAVALREPEQTGSIPRAPISFGRELDEEDWRRAHAALGVALDPQGNGRPVKWENPASNHRGAVNPTGLPYVANDEICRDFLASVVTPGSSRFVRGTGCKPSGGAWALKRLAVARR